MYYVVFLLVIIVLLLGVLALGIGLMIGYGILGKGQDPWAILAPEKWHELIAKIYREMRVGQKIGNSLEFDFVVPPPHS